MLILFIANLFDMPAWKVTVLLQLLSDHLLKILYSLMLLFIFVNDSLVYPYGSQVYNYLYKRLRERV